MLQPVAPRLDWATLEGRMRSRSDEIDDLMALLLEHADRDQRLLGLHQA